ncbi:tetratricopeptide repeat protein [Pseudoroseicyclus sp. CXY001]|uniref:tetratricopeptide repeat protein n=1 Tax=Pseudoroseicyclus sp. CXY001 TaxID=3242492 RepID=UPI003570D1B4
MRGIISVLAATAALATPGHAEDVGAYLAGRSAAQNGDFEAAASYYISALAEDQGRADLATEALTAFVQLGAFDRALPLAERVEPGTGLPALVRTVALAETGDWGEILTRLDAGLTIAPLPDALTRAWALVGAGRMREALAAFDAMAADRAGDEGRAGFALYNKALALAMAGDLEGAEAIFTLPPAEGLPLTRRGVLAHAVLLGQMGRGEEGAALIRRIFGERADAGMTALAADLAAGRITRPLVPDAAAGLAEVYYSLSAAMSGREVPDPRQLIYARAALWLAPEHFEAMLLAARACEALGRPDLATAILQGVAEGSPDHLAAEMTRAATLRRTGAPDEAARVLAALAAAHPARADLQASLGDSLRELARYPEAVEAYGRALQLYADGAPMTWVIHYTRGISRQEAGNWPGAEADFRRALELNPGQPRVLNHLGYALVTRGESLDEALAMVRLAVAAEPENAAIIDSLGWALYRLGRVAEAVPHLERAVEIEAGSPVINEHLGDAYWQVGRREEARFQWRRALSFEPEAAMAARLEQKLASGLVEIPGDSAALEPAVANGG